MYLYKRTCLFIERILPLLCVVYWEAKRAHLRMKITICMQTPRALFATHPLNSLALRLRPPELCGVLDLHLNGMWKKNIKYNYARAGQVFSHSAIYTQPNMKGNFLDAFFF